MQTMDLQIFISYNEYSMVGIEVRFRLGLGISALTSAFLSHFKKYEFEVCITSMAT